MSDVSRLPGPVSDLWEWQRQALCRGMAITLFFHPWGERGPTREARENMAKRICAGCPVITECRRHALTVHEPYGVWGGLTEGERQGLLRQSSSAVGR